MFNFINLEESADSLPFGLFLPSFIVICLFRVADFRSQEPNNSTPRGESGRWGGSFLKLHGLIMEETQVLREFRNSPPHRLD
jgi:hypothetical protein